MAPGSMASMSPADIARRRELGAAAALDGRGTAAIWRRRVALVLDLLEQLAGAPQRILRAALGGLERLPGAGRGDVRAYLAQTLGDPARGDALLW